jgi:hypothetical protein
MPRKKQDPEESQRTEKDYEIPVPKRKDVFDALGKAARTPKRGESGKAKPRTSRNR